MASRKTWALFAVLPLLFGFDFWSKDWVRDNLAEGEQLAVVPGWVSLLHAENPDVAFSMPVPLPVVFVAGAVALVVLAFTWWRLPKEAWIPSLAIGAITAGALGNLIDRIPDGSVTDMVRVYTEHPALSAWLIDTFGTATWPIFNVADSALIGGVGIWFANDLFRGDDEELPDLAGDA